MRKEFCAALLDLVSDSRFVFLTGDLGFNALEPVQTALGQRFINAGVAEQNMVSVAAGLARGGLRPWVYSIAPFVYARPFEQIRNDVCFHDLPVRLVGNGGGYAYGVMGATHHAIEDYGTMLCLPHMRAYIPAFSTDVATIVSRLQHADHPAYLRLGLAEEPKDMVLPPYAAWRCIVRGGGPTLLIVGALAGGIITLLRTLDDALRPTIWVVTELPFDALPSDFVDDVQRSQHVVVVEEHVVHGGAGQMIGYELLRAGVALHRFEHHHAQGYVSGLYGSQNFHRAESGIDAASVAATLKSMIVC